MVGQAQPGGAGRGGDGLPPHVPGALQGEGVRLQGVGEGQLLAALRETSGGERGGPGRPQVRLRGPRPRHGGGVVLGGEHGLGQGGVRVGLTQQLTHEPLGGGLTTLPEGHLTQLAGGVGEVVGGPVAVAEAPPGGQVGVHRHGVGDTQPPGALAHVVRLLLKGVLRGVDADDLQPVGGVGLVEPLDTGDGALAVDARVGPEVDELDLSRPVRLAQGLVAGGVEPRGGPRDGGQGAAVGQVVGARDAGPVRPRAPAVEEPVDAGLEGGGVVGQGALEGRGQVEDERHGQGDHEGPGGQAHAPLTGAKGLKTLGDPLPRQREGQQGHGGAQGEGQGQGHGVRADPPGGARHGDGRQDRAGAGDVGGAQDQAQGEAAGGVA